MDATRIQAVGSRADLRRFLKYPFARYRNDPHWVPPLLISEREQFDPEKNPFYEHARLSLFLAVRGGRAVGRMRLPILGVAPEYRNRGFELAMIYELYGCALAKGYQRCEASWTLEDNRAMNHLIGAGGARHYKTYRVYQKEL